MYKDWVLFPNHSKNLNRYDWWKSYRWVTEDRTPILQYIENEAGPQCTGSKGDKYDIM